MKRTAGRLPSRMPLALFAVVGLSLFVAPSKTIAAPPEAVSRVADAVGSAGLQFAQDRQIDQWLDAARGHIERREFAVAFGFLARVFSSDVETLTAHGPASILSRDEAWRLTQRLPEELRTRFEADLDRTAGDAWAVVRTSDSHEQIATFAMQHRFSQAGLEGLRMLAAARRDTGQHELSAAGWGRVAEHPRATTEQRTLARLARIESLIAATHLQEASRVCRAALDTELAPNITLGGRSISPREWLDARLNEINEALPARHDSSPLSPVKLPQLTDTDPRPTLQPSWSRLTPPAANLTKTISDTQRYFRGQGVVSSLSLRPLVVGRVAIARTMEHLIALDLATGEPAWKEPVPHPEYAWMADSPPYLEKNESFRSNLIGAWHRRTEADSVFSTLTTDGQIVIAVMEPDRSRFEFPLNGTTRPGRQNGQTPPGPRWNRLSAYDVATGELRWQIGGEATGPADLLGGYRFLGPPLPVDNLLFGVARREDSRLIGQSSLNLLALDSLTGHLRWSVVLGVVPPHLTDAVASLRIACPITLADGRLLCPTASGALIAVDPVTRGIAWVARYPIQQRDQPTPPVNGIGVSVAADAWWNEWREVTCVASASRVIFASPELDRLQGLELDTGRAVWSAPRSGALHVAGLFEDLAVVIEPMAVRAHDLNTGAVRWRCETGEISGRGTIIGSQLLQPRRAGGVAIVDLKDGSRRDSLVSAETILGTLIPCEDGWISQTEQSLTKLPLLTRARDEALAKWTGHTTDEPAALDLARLDLQADDPAAARSRLLDMETPRAKALRREALLALLGSLSHDTRPAGDSRPDREGLSQELLALSTSNDERLVALRAIGEAAATSDPVQAVTWFLEGLELLDTHSRRSKDDWSADSVAARSVRRDRVFVGSIERVLADVTRRSRLTPADGDSVTQRQRIEQIFAARLQAARAHSDPFAVQRLVDRLLPLEWGRHTLLAETKSVQFARTLKKSEPALLTVSAAREERLAVEASRQLIYLLLRSGWHTEADAVERRLLIEYPDATFDRASPTPDSAADAADAADAHEAERRARLLSPPADPWPNVIPSIEIEPKDRHEDVHYVAVSVDAAPGSLLDRLDVAVDRQGLFVRFAGEGHAGKWLVTLGGPSSALRPGFAALDQCQAWGVGRLLVLRLGSELFCISPLDERGEPHAKSEWPIPIDLTGGLTSRATDMPTNAEHVPARVGLRHAGLRLVDGFGRAIGRVGPVRPDYLCYQSQARLVAIETQTGRRLWERLDIPPHCIAFGDEDRVYLWRTSERTLQVLSAIDGRTLETRPWDVSSDDLLQQRGSLTWLAVGGGPETRVELHDARDGALRWSASFAPQAVPFVLDRNTLGVVEPNGLLHLLSADSGQPLGKPLTVAVPAKLDRIVCHRDEWRWYVAFSGPVAKQALLQTEQIHGGRRLPFLNGPWYAIDRATRVIAWQRQLDNEPLSLDASRMAPIFVQMWRQPNLGNTAFKGGEGCLRLIDKRSGREVAFRKDVSLQPYFVLKPTANRETLDIHTEREIVRLKYTPHTER